MKWSRRVLSIRGKVLPVAVFVIGAAFLLYSAMLSDTVANASAFDAQQVVSAPAATFAADAGTLGAIPDHAAGCDATGAAPRNVTFTVSGLSGTVSSVEVNNLTFGGPIHSWVGDIEAVLIAPNGASHTVFGRTGETTAGGCGDSSDLAGPYTFANSAAAPPNGGWWQTATIIGAGSMTSGAYRTTAIGGAGATNPQPPTNMNAAFAGVANANGTWTLRLSDHGGGDTGAVSAATLTVNTAVAVPVDANADFDGDGKTDYAVARPGSSFAPEASDLLPGRPKYSTLDERPVRTRKTVDEAVPQAPTIFWWVNYSSSNNTQVFAVGDAATDFITPEDFDGDGKDDVAVWTEGAATVANFKVFQSTTNTLATYTFGQTGDDPAVVGDYDGDGKADPAVYRCPGVANPDGQCYFFYRGSMNNPSGNITYVPWGFGVDGDFFPYVGDFDGDGKNDFNIQRSNPAAPVNGQFVMLKSGGGVEYIDWGLASDFLIPGDYDGDGKTDLCVRRTVSGQRHHFILFRNGTNSFVNWGVTGDSSVPGDYDGDGKTDVAIWRGSATPNQSNFWILNSSTATLTIRPWGQCPTVATCDFAVAGWAVH